MEKTIEELITEETSKRLKEMEAPDYEFPPKISRADIAAIAASIAASLVLIILCMTEVIV